jgi:SAM-dependent methyltransferase
MPYDPQRAEAFADEMVDTLNKGGLCLMLSLGHRSGLLAVMADLPPATSGRVAEAAGLQERYVREWLGALTAAGVVAYDPARDTYSLPAEHAAWLNPGGDDNIAVFAQYIPLLGAVEDDVLACFRDGGGVPYHRYPRFHDVMAEDSGQTVLTSLFDHILPLAPELPGRLGAGADVLDLGCGSGKALIRLAEAYPASRFLGLDLSAEAVGRARDEAERRGLTNIAFEVRDLRGFDRTAEPGAFDLVTTFDAVHDQPDPQGLLRGIHRTLKPGGIYLMQDIHHTGHPEDGPDHPLGPLLFTLSCMHCMTVSLAQGGEGLGAMWGREKARAYLGAAGFGEVAVHRLDHDIQNDYFVSRKAPGQARTS